MKIIKATNSELEFEYLNADERNTHIMELLQQGWVLTHTSGAAVMVARFKKEE